jgi:hypothetical protein
VPFAYGREDHVVARVGVDQPAGRRLQREHAGDEADQDDHEDHLRPELAEDVAEDRPDGVGDLA